MGILRERGAYSLGGRLAARFDYDNLVTANLV